MNNQEKDILMRRVTTNQKHSTHGDYRVVDRAWDMINNKLIIKSTITGFSIFISNYTTAQHSKIH